MTDRDRDRVARCLRGDEDAFAALYRTHVGPVAAYFGRSGFGAADVDDLVQRTFVRAYRSLRTFDASRGTFGVWLAAIARNVARKRWRRRREPEHFDPELAEAVLPSPDDPGAVAADREAVAAVRACVEALPPDLARIVRLRYVEGRTTRGIAAAEGMAEATVRARLGEARDLVARCLKAKGVLP